MLNVLLPTNRDSPVNRSLSSAVVWFQWKNCLKMWGKLFAAERLQLISTLFPIKLTWPRKSKKNRIRIIHVWLDVYFITKFSALYFCICISVNTNSALLCPFWRLSNSYGSLLFPYELTFQCKRFDKWNYQKKRIQCHLESNLWHLRRKQPNLFHVFLLIWLHLKMKIMC